MSNLKLIIASISILFLFSCTKDNETQDSIFKNDYLDYSGRDDVLSGGVKMINISTPKGEFMIRKSSLMVLSNLSKMLMKANFNPLRLNF